MLSRGLNDEINEILGKELRGKLNEALILILLIKNYDAAQESRKGGFKGFRGRRDRPVVPEGLTTRDIADQLDLPQSTVATAVKRISERDWVTHSKGMPVKTTEQGREVAKEKLRHHRLLEVMLAESLGITPDEAHNESVKLMLLTSCELIMSIEERYDNPTVCPCGEPIPETDLCSVKIANSS